MAKILAKKNMYPKRLISILKHMKQRCLNPNNSNYKNYGGRGISICNEWINNTTSFYLWALNNGYNDGLTIDRIDADGNYEPTNCRWITNKEQQRNRTNNHLITLKNETHTVIEWAEILNVTYNTIIRKEKNNSLYELIN